MTAQVYQPGYFVAAGDTTFGEFRISTFGGKLKKLKQSTGKLHHGNHIDAVYLNGLQYEKVNNPETDRPFFLQRLIGDSIRVYQQPALKNPTYFYSPSRQELIPLEKGNLNPQLQEAFAECPVLGNSMAFLKVPYKKHNILPLFSKYHECINLPMPIYRRRDSLEWHLQPYIFHTSGLTRGQRNKDYSGEFTNVNYGGYGINAMFGVNRPWALGVGVQYIEGATSNSFANVPPRNDRDFFSEVDFTWVAYEFPISVVFNMDFRHFDPYIGFTGSAFLMKNLILSERYHAPYLPEPFTRQASLVTQKQIGLGLVGGVNKNLTRKFAVGIDYKMSFRELTFNLVRIDRSNDELPPDISTFYVTTPNVVRRPNDMSKLSFFVQEVSFRLSYRMYSYYRTF